MFLLILGLLAVATLIFWKIAGRVHRRFAFAGIPGPPSQNWKMGNLAQLLSPHSGGFLRYLESLNTTVVKVHGSLGDTLLFVFDPLGVKQALHNVDVYPPTDLFLQANRMMFGMGLLSCVGQAHHRQRKMLNVAFSSESLRLMAPIFFDVADMIQLSLRTELENAAGNIAEVDLLSLASKGALEIIGKAGLGYSFDAFSNRTNPYSQAFQTLIPTVFSMFTARQAVGWFVDYLPSRLARAAVAAIPWAQLQHVRRMVNTLDNMSKEVYSDRMSELLSHGHSSSLDVKGKDIISTILRQNEQASPEDQLSESDIRAQVATLILTATDTTAGAIARILHVLSENLSAQETLRQEISQAQLSFDTVHTLRYLDAICKETLRLYPPLPYTTRTTKRDTVMTLSKPLHRADGVPIHEIFIPNDTNVIIGILAFNRNPDIWGEDAHLWKPERWYNLPEAVKDMNRAGVYANTITFFGGGKSCIGYKFSELEIKIVVSTLISAFSFTPSDKDVTWCMRGMAKPMISDSPSPQMPLKVSAI